MTNCTNHCGACGLHFHSLAAFDAHRQGDYAKPTGTEEGRHCVHPFDMDGRLVAITEYGVCKMYAEPQIGITVWTLAAHVGKTGPGARLRKPAESTGQRSEGAS
jgi:hypothetical protein